MIHLLLKGMRYDDCTAQASTRPFIVSVKRQYFPLPHLLTPFFPDSSAVPSDLRRLTRSASAQRHVVVLAYTLLRDTTYDFARACSSDEKEPLGPCGRLARAGRIECLGRARPRAGLRRRRAHPARSGSRPPGRGDARGGPGPGDDLQVGREVQAGEVLVELDSTAQRLQLEEAQQHLRALARLSGNLPPSGLKGITRSLKAQDLDIRPLPKKCIH